MSFEARSHTTHPQFSVAFDYPVVFTQDVFAPDNHTLLEVLCRREPTPAPLVRRGGLRRMAGRSRSRRAHRGLLREPSSALQLVAPPLVAPGGEACKQTPALVDELHAKLHAHGIDRHSFVVIDRRRGRARRRRLRGRDGAPRRARRARADHGARAERLRRRREERHQRLRREELPRHLRAAVRRHQRRRVSARRCRRATRSPAWPRR